MVGGMYGESRWWEVCMGSIGGGRYVWGVWVVGGMYGESRWWEVCMGSLGGWRYVWGV